MIFKKEFERRLLKLYGAIGYYFSSGNEGDLLPSLFSVYSYLWSFKAVGAYKKK